MQASASTDSITGVLNRELGSGPVPPPPAQAHNMDIDQEEMAKAQHHRKSTIQLRPRTVPQRTAAQSTSQSVPVNALTAQPTRSRPRAANSVTKSAYPDRLRRYDNALWVTMTTRQSFSDAVLSSSAGRQKNFMARRITPHYPVSTAKDDKYRQFMTELSEVLIPVRLNIEYEGQRIQDALTWNLNDPSMTPRHYAEIFCEDLNLPVHYVTLVSEMIQTQLTEYRDFLKSGVVLNQGYVPIDLEIQIGKTLFKDRFMWDISADNTTTPEQFARRLCSEMGLCTEFRLLISHSIREQVSKHVMDYSAVEHLDLDGTGSNDSVTRRSVYKTATESTLPAVEELDDLEWEQMVRAQERQSRRLRRESRRR
jgi:SWI/SNF-related matrix-associated actin-dependent regulator of chromatin subfamily B member 1